MQQTNTFLSQTVSGRKLSIPAATRLPIPLYERAVAIADKQGLSLAKLLNRWITEKLEEVSGEQI